MKIKIILIILTLLLSFNMVNALIYQSTYKRWDNEIRPISEMKTPFTNDYPYKVVKYDSYYNIITFEDNFNIPKKNWLYYTFIPNKISPKIIINHLSQFNNIAIDHNETVKYISISNILNINSNNIIKFSKNWFWDNDYIIRDSGFNDLDEYGEFINYSYFNKNDGEFKVINGELRFYAKKQWFINANYPISINFNSFTFNGSGVQSCWDNIICNRSIINGTDNNLGLISYNKTPLNDDLFIEYVYNDNTSDFIDSSGNDNNAVNSGTTGVNGYYGIGREHDGTDDFINTTSSLQSTFRGNWSIITWIKPDDCIPSTPERLFGSRNVLAEDQIFWNMRTDGKQQILFESNNNQATGITTNAVFINGDCGWQHITIVGKADINGVGGILVYNNGSEILSINTNGVLFNDFTSDINFVFGGQNQNGNVINDYNGLHDEFRIWNKSLTPTEIINLFNDSFVNSSNITTKGLGLVNNTISTNFDNIPLGTSFNILYNGTGNFINLCIVCLNNTNYPFISIIGGEIRIELISTPINTPMLKSFTVSSSLFNITSLKPSNNTIVNLNGTVFDQEFNLTSIDNSFNLSNATLLIWNKSSGEEFDYFVKEFINNIENVEGNVFTGNIESLRTPFDGNALIINENAGPNALDFRFNFTNIDPRYNNYTVHVVADYTGGDDHDMNVSIFNYTSNSFINLFSIPESGIGTLQFSNQLKTSDILNGDNNATLRINHIQNGNTNHILFLGHIALHSENETKKVINITNNTESGIIASLPNGIFQWNYEVINIVDQTVLNESNLTFTVISDTTLPLITFISPTPDNNTIINISNVLINATTSEILLNITLNLSDGRIFEMERLTAFEFQINITGLNDNTIYFYNVTGTDVVGNVNITGTRNFNTSFPFILTDISETIDISEIETDDSNIFLLFIYLFTIFFLYIIAINRNSWMINVIHGFIIIIITALINTTIFIFRYRIFITNINSINNSIVNASIYNNNINKFTIIYEFQVDKIYIVLLLVLGLFLFLRGSLLRKGEDKDE